MRTGEPIAKVHKPLKYILSHTDGRVHQAAKLLAKQGEGKALNIIARQLYIKPNK